MFSKIVILFTDTLAYLVNVIFFRKPNAAQIELKSGDDVSKAVENCMKEEVVELISEPLKKRKPKKSKQKKISKSKLWDDQPGYEKEESLPLTFEGFPDSQELDAIKSVRLGLFRSSEKNKIPFKEAVITSVSKDKTEEKPEIKINPKDVSLIIFLDSKGKNKFEEANQYYLNLLQEIESFRKNKDETKQSQVDTLKKLYFNSVQLLESLTTAFIQSGVKEAPVMFRIRILRNIMAHRFDLFLDKNVDSNFLMHNFIDENTSFYDYVVFVYKFLHLTCYLRLDNKQKIQRMMLQAKIDELADNEFVLNVFSINKDGKIKTPQHAISNIISNIIFSIEVNKQIIRKFNKSGDAKEDTFFKLKILFMEMGSWVRVLKEQNERSEDFKMIFNQGISKVDSQELLKDLLKASREGSLEKVKDNLQELTAGELFGLILMLRHCYFHHESQQKYNFHYQQLDQILPEIANRTLHCLPDIKEKLKLSLELEDNHSKLSLK